MPAWVDLTGKRFANLTAISYAGNSKWNCVCDCGGTSVVVTHHLRNGNTTSCGCVKRSVLGKSTTKHGAAGTRTYRIWKAMRNRCNNKNTPRYKDYGGRGIKVCARWDDYAAFLSDMGEAPGGCSIDRIDNDGNYEPSNCRWATRAEQASNTRTSVLVNGKTITQIAKEQGVTYMKAWKQHRRDIESPVGDNIHFDLES